MNIFDAACTSTWRQEWIVWCGVAVQTETTKIHPSTLYMKLLLKPVIDFLKQMYVTARFTDGLGNRLFQMAAVLWYAKKHGHTPVFVKEWITPQAHATAPIGIVELYPEIPTVSLSSVEWKQVEEPADGAFTFYELPFVPTNVQLNGCFQSYAYLEAVPTVPRLLLSADTALESCAFLHVRRGDYLLDVCRHHNVPLAEYMRYALSGLACAETGTRVLVCSNDLEWCRKELPVLYGDLVPAEHWIFFEGDEIQTLAAMIRCGRGGIAANSTFSYWGAAFNTSLHAHPVYMPAVWGFPPLPPVRDLYPPWATILPTK